MVEKPFPDLSYGQSDFSVVITYFRRSRERILETKLVRDVNLGDKSFDRLVSEYILLDRNQTRNKISQLYFFAVPRRLNFNPEKVKTDIEAKMDTLRLERLECLGIEAAAEDMSYFVIKKAGRFKVAKKLYHKPYDKIMGEVHQKMAYNDKAQILLERLLRSINPQIKIVDLINKKSKSYWV